MTATRKKIHLFLHGLPEYEILFPLARALHRRGKVDLTVHSSAAVLRREPRLRALVRDAGIALKVRPNRLLKMFHGWWLAGADAVLGITDPWTDTSATAGRSRAIAARSIPSIFLQHGVIQTRLNFGDGPVSYYSGLLLLFEDLLRPEVVDAAARARTRTVGFLKPVLLPPKAPAPAVVADLARYRRRILLCQSFRWEGRYGEEQMAAFYALVRAFAERHPDTLVILRSHRGKARATYDDQDRALRRAVPNVAFSNERSGPFAGLGVTDVLALVDAMVSTTSTVILDALTMNVPAAVFANDQPVFRDLQDVTDLASLEAFVDAPDLAACARVRAHYGDTDANIARACAAIEDYVAAL